MSLPVGSETAKVENVNILSSGTLGLFRLFLDVLVMGVGLDRQLEK